MYKVIVLPPAKKDISDIAHRYNSKKIGLGKRFTSEIKNTVSFIQKNPKAIAVRYDNTRTAIVKVFPVMIHFSIEEAKKTIVVSSVFSTSINPDIWNKKNELL